MPWDAITAIASALMALVLVGSLWYAKRQVDEARSLRKQQVRPCIVVDLVPSKASRHFLDLSIRNVGMTVAYNVRLDFEPLPKRSVDRNEKPLSESRLLKEGIPAVPPGRDHTTFFESLSELDQRDDLPRSYSVGATYIDASGEEHTETYILDLEFYMGLGFIEVKELHHGVKELEKLRKAVEKLQGRNR